MINDLDETLAALLRRELPSGMAACFLAADNGDLVDMGHLLRATQREYQEMEKVASDFEFVPVEDAARVHRS